MNNFHQLAQIINSINSSVNALGKTVSDTRQRVTVLEAAEPVAAASVSSENNITVDIVTELIKTTKTPFYDELKKLIDSNVSTASFMDDIKKLIRDAEFSDAQVEQIKNIITSEILLDLPLVNIAIPSSIDIDDNIIVGLPKDKKKPRGRAVSTPVVVPVPIDVTPSIEVILAQEDSSV